MLLYVQSHCCIPNTTTKINCWEPESCVRVFHNLYITQKWLRYESHNLTTQKRASYLHPPPLFLLFPTAATFAAKERKKYCKQAHILIITFPPQPQPQRKKGGEETQKSRPHFLPPPASAAAKGSLGRGKESQPNPSNSLPACHPPNHELLCLLLLLLFFSRYMSHGLGSLSLSPLCPPAKGHVPILPSFLPSPGMTASGGNLHRYGFCKRFCIETAKVTTKIL